MSAVPEKSEGEEEQNTITVRPEETTSAKKSKTTSPHPPVSGSALLSSRNGSTIPSRNESGNPRKYQPVLELPRAQSRNTTIRESLSKLDAPITLAVTPSIINSTSPRRHFATLWTAKSNTSALRADPQSDNLAIKPQALIPSKQPPTSPRRQKPTSPTTPQLLYQTTATSPQPQKQPTASTTTLTAPTRHSFIPATSQPITSSVIQSSFQPSSQPVTQTTMKFTTAVTIPPIEVPTLPASFLSPPTAEFKDHDVGNPVTDMQTEIPFVSVRKNLTLPSSTKPHVAQEKNNLVQTEQPRKGHNMMPGSVARSPGNRFSFSSHKEREPVLTPEELQRIVFQPLLARPRTKTRRILTSAPSLLPIDPANFTDAHHHLFPMRIEFQAPSVPEDSSSRDSLDLKLSNSQSVQTPSRILETPSESTILHPLSASLSPPTRPFTSITGMKQEFPTFLEIPSEINYSLRTSPRDTFLPGARRLPFPPSSQGNRDFFIPSAEFSLLVSEIPQNNVEDLIPQSNHKLNNHHQHHHGIMTMVFPAPIEPSKMEELKLNPECPRCHPEFLKPGQCHPCVVIK